jgi:putative membrane protein
VGSALFAFLHHLAAFALVATLVVEFVLLRGELDPPSARCIQRTDMAFGISSGVLLVVGLLRVFYFEKGSAYYFHSAPFIAKLVLFVAVALLSIVPTMEFLSWSKALKQGRSPVLGDGKRRQLRAIMHAELVGIVLILLCAALMARGIGFFG